MKTDNEGAILGVILVLLLVFSLLGLGLMEQGTQDGIEASKIIQKEKAFWAAEAGLQHVMAIGRTLRRPYEDVDGWSGGVTIGGHTDRGDSSVAVAPDLGNLGSRVKGYTMTSTGTSLGGHVRTLSSRAQINSFASYMHASNYDDLLFNGKTVRLFFHNGNILDGVVYINDVVRILNEPIFLGHVYSAKHYVDYKGPKANESVFRAGLTLNAPPLDFSTDHVSQLAAEANNGGFETPPNEDVLITFTNSKFLVQKWAAGGPVGPISTNGYGNGAIYVDGTAHVQGVVGGRVTLAAEHAILIESNLVYQGATNINPWATNFIPTNVTDRLGLVARDRVSIETLSDTEIHAAILVTEGECLGCGFGALVAVTVTPTVPVDPLHVELKLWGSISQYRRGVLKSKYGGFQKNYKYDTRFVDAPPPFFPYSLYTFSDWEEK